ncbi:MAG: electron transport complex subunit E [Bacteroidales bacterium]|nr:electron transport complex subunit E [Bacteroidales bacterium]
MTNWQIFSKGLIRENPTFVLILGMCPVLATTTAAMSGMSMGLATTFVLVLSNMVISAIARFIPDKVRIPSYIVVIASFVTVVDLLMAAYVNTPGADGGPSLYDQLGIFVPLIVVNCIVLGRAEAFASKNGVWPSFLDGLGIGLGFTLALTLLGAIREFFGAGTFFGLPVLPSSMNVLVFIMAPGAFIVLGYVIALVNRLRKS